MSSVQIIGLEELNNDFRTYPQGKAKAFQMAGNNYAKFVFNDANRTVPVKTGRLKRSIGTSVNQHEIRLFATAPYAGLINFGTGRMPARPFLTKPTEDYLDRFVNEYADGILDHFRK